MYRKSIDLWPNYEHALNNLANLIRKNRGKLGEAKSLLKRAIEANPKVELSCENVARLILGVLTTLVKQF